jgi:Na+/H+-translocating membrane pyrophosphatase
MIAASDGLLCSVAVVIIAGEDIRERTDALDAAGNTTAAIGKGFAIGSAALVSLALFGAYITRAKIDLIESSILDPKVRAVVIVILVVCYCHLLLCPSWNPKVS